MSSDFSEDSDEGFSVVTFFATRDEADENLRLGFYRGEICEYLGIAPGPDDVAGANGSVADVVATIGAEQRVCGVRCRGAEEPRSGKFCIFVQVGTDDPHANDAGNRDYDAEPMPSGDVEADEMEDCSDDAGGAPGAPLNVRGGKWLTCWWGAFSSERLSLDHNSRFNDAYDFEVLRSSDDVLRRMTARMQQLATLLFESVHFEVEPEVCLALLRKNKWDPRVVAERYFVDDYGPSFVDRMGHASTVDFSTLASVHEWDECQTCQTVDEGAFVHLGVAAHAMCVQCWRDCAAAALVSDGIAMIDMVRDERIVSDAVWEQFLSAAQWKRFVERVVDEYVSTSTTTLSCVANPRGGCSCYVEAPSAVAAAECPLYHGVRCACGINFCASCSLLAKSGSSSSAADASWRAESSAAAASSSAAATAADGASSSSSSGARRRVVGGGDSISFAALGDAACNRGDHRPATCEMVGRWVSETGSGGSSEDRSEAWIKANSKQCPKCGVLIVRDRGCLEMQCNACKEKFCYACGQHGKKWEMSHFKVPNPSKFRCPVTEARRAKEAQEAAMAGGDAGREALARLESERLAKRQGEMVSERDAAVSFRRVVSEHLLGTTASGAGAAGGGSPGAVQLRKGALRACRGEATLVFLDDAAEESMRCCDVLAATPIYTYYQFWAVAGGHGSREAALVRHSATQLAAQVKGLVRLVGVDDARVPPIDGDATGVTRIGRRANDFATADAEQRVHAQLYREWRETVASRTASLRKACEVHIRSAKETRLDRVVDVAARGKDERRWKAALVWMARQTPQLRPRDLHVDDAGSGSSDSSASDDPAWLSQLRLLEQREPMHPWEAFVDADAAPEAIWLWSGIGGAVKWTPYGAEAQPIVEACYQELIAPGGTGTGACTVTSAGSSYEVEIDRKGEGTQFSKETNGRRQVKREERKHPAWICAACRMQCKEGTIICYLCGWNKALDAYSPCPGGTL